jgi:hypothetical protein
MLLAGVTAAEPAPPASNATGDTVAVWNFDAKTTDDIRGIIGVAVMHGFPDAAGGTLVAGTLSAPTSTTTNERAHHLSTMTINGKEVKPAVEIAEGVTNYHGFHLKLANGRWLAGITTLLAAKDDMFSSISNTREWEITFTAGESDHVEN